MALFQHCFSAMSAASAPIHNFPFFSVFFFFFFSFFNSTTQNIYAKSSLKPWQAVRKEWILFYNLSSNETLIRSSKVRNNEDSNQ